MKYQLAGSALIGIVLSQSNLYAAAISLGDAMPFAVLGASTVTNTGDSFIIGDLGLNPGTSITGFPPGVVNGFIYTNDALSSSAQTAALQAYNDLGLMVTTSDLTGQNLAQTLSPGVYHYDTSAALSGTLVLDGLGDFIFLIGSTLTTSSASSITLINGANARDVFLGLAHQRPLELLRISREQS